MSRIITSAVDERRLTGCLGQAGGELGARPRPGARNSVVEACRSGFDAHLTTVRRPAASLLYVVQPHPRKRRTT